MQTDGFDVSMYNLISSALATHLSVIVKNQFPYEWKLMNLTAALVPVLLFYWATVKWPQLLVPVHHSFML